VPQYEGPGEDVQPDAARAVREWLAARGGSAIEVVAQGETPTDDPAAAREIVAGWDEVGCGWWLETRWDMPHAAPERMRQVRARLEAGPPRPS